MLLCTHASLLSLVFFRARADELPASIGEDNSSSHHRTAPRYGWGTGGRNKLAAGGFIGLATPAACEEFYELDVAFGQQQVSSRKTQPAYSLALDSRFDDTQKARQRAAAPGPGSYKAVAGIGYQVDSTKPSQPQCGFSRSGRFRRGQGRASDNAGLNGDMRSAVGRQVVSDRRSKPSYGFGSARRFNWDRPASAAPSTPGPGSYNA